MKSLFKSIAMTVFVIGLIVLAYAAFKAKRVPNLTDIKQAVKKEQVVEKVKEEKKLTQSYGTEQSKFMGYSEQHYKNQAKRYLRKVLKVMLDERMNKQERIKLDLDKFTANIYYLEKYHNYSDEQQIEFFLSAVEELEKDFTPEEKLMWELTLRTEIEKYVRSFNARTQRLKGIQRYHTAYF